MTIQKNNDGLPWITTNLRSAPVVEESWVGFDLDGTLAKHTGGYSRKADAGLIGEPIWVMIELLKSYLKAGYRVKIFTARADREAEKVNIRLWLGTVGLPMQLEITNRKDYHMLHFYDDRAITVQQDTGKILTHGA